MIDGVVAIVGRPNVGKSTLFNRMIEERRSIVDDQPGVTRDRIYGVAKWLTREFRVIDTGGIELADRPFQEQIRAQAQIAIEESDVIVFVVDGRRGMDDDDLFVVKMLNKSGKPILLAVNKIDDVSKQLNIYEFYNLGIGDPIAISSVHGIGVGDLMDKIVSLLPRTEQELPEGIIKFCFIGRPNVGKSSLVNAVLNEERVIVSPIEGTTRDAIDTTFNYEGRDYVVIDTAGLKKRGRIFESVDKYAALRALSAIDRSDIAVLVIDAETGIREQDKNVVGYALESKKAIVLAVNKWDTIVKDDKTMSDYTKKLRAEFQFLDYAPIVFLSALHKSRLHTLFNAILQAFESYTKRVVTSTLNHVVLDAQMSNPAPDFNGGRLRIKYAAQVGIRPPTFVLFVNEPENLHFSYQRYIENQLRYAFGFEGTPLTIVARASE